ncbi:MAG: hypothetical protein WDZ76_06260 [Pseudohongiellaceae bacterium]
MKKTIINTLAGLLLLLGSQAFAADNSAITGTWLMSLDAQGMLIDLDLTITETTEGLTGSMGSSEFGVTPVSDVTFDGDTLSFNAPDQQGGSVDIKMTLEEGKLSGMLNSSMGSIPATASKK